MSHLKQWIVGGLLGLLVAGAMVAVWNGFQKQSGFFSTQGENQKADGFTSVRDKFVFAPYVLESSQFTPNVSGNRVALKELQNLKSFERPVPPQDASVSKTVPYQFTDIQKQSLAEKNFMVTPVHDLEYENDPNTESGRVDDWTQVYDKIGGEWSEYYRAPENAPFVTTDYVLHVYHRLLEQEFERAEYGPLFDHVHSLSAALFERATAARLKSRGVEAESFDRLSGYFLVPLALTESVLSEKDTMSSADTKIDTLEAASAVVDRFADQLSPGTRRQVEAELALLFGATDIAVPPLLGQYILAANPDYQEDYTQYGPRSHYSKNSVLRAYFRSMMWFGRQNLLAASPELTRDALTIAGWMSDPELKQTWEAIYIPTTFFVGESDDLGIYEYQNIVSAVDGVGQLTAGDIRQAQKLAQEYPSPKILSTVLSGEDVLSKTTDELRESTRGFRFMGQRFTPDAFVLNHLTKGQEQGPKLPSMPTALMVTTVLGDSTSETLLGEWIDRYHAEKKGDIRQRLGELQQTFSSFSENLWGQNIYWAWTRTLKTLFQQPETLTGYPFFMQHEAWRRKDLQAALGSWTELKHDTLLYAKQSYAERGGGGDEPSSKPEVSKGYVEPNIAFWDRLLALSKMTYQGMRDLGLLDQTLTGRNEQLIASLEFFRSMALKQIENQEITEADFEKLRREPARLQTVIEPLPGDLNIEDNARSALIADIHTDAVQGKVLYVANAKPSSIFVAVKDKNGARLTRGLVYTYYEFAGPLGKRFTDGDWRAAVYQGEAFPDSGDTTTPFPSRPSWTESLK